MAGFEKASRAGIATLLALAIPQAIHPVSAEPVIDRALSSVQVVEDGRCARARIGFNFRVRYLSHFPVDGGQELRIKVRAVDPFLASLELVTRRESLRPPASPLAAIRGIEFELGHAGGPMLTVYFRKDVKYDVAQGADFKSIVVAIQSDKGTSGCAADFPTNHAGAWQAVVTPAERRAEQRIARRNDARESGTPLTSAKKKKIRKLMADARKALTGKKHRQAVRLLSKVLLYPENAQSAEAQELLGLARQRLGQLAHAKAEYKEYLKRYPGGAGAKRVRQRLDAILTAGKAPKPRLRKARRKYARKRDDGTHWSVNGSVSEFYFRDESVRNFVDQSLPPDLDNEDTDHRINQNELLSSFDVTARWGNGRYDSEFRFSGSEQTAFDDDDEDEFSVASLYLETEVRDWQTVIKGGRQTRNTGGVLGRFDGLLVSHQVLPDVRLNAVGGSPVARRRDLPFEYDKYFWGLSADVAGIAKNLDTTVYYVEQRDDNLIDRRAVGVEARYFDENKSAFGVLDYDVNLNELNTAFVTGSLVFPDKSTLHASLDYRNSPTIFTSNALQGQTVSSLSELREKFTLDEIERFARDRTATSKTATVGFSRPLNDMLQVNGDVTVSNISGTDASGGVPASPSTGNEYFYSAQLIASSVFRENDTFVAGIRFADRQTSDITVLEASARYPLMPGLRLTPRLRWSYRDDDRGDFTEYALLPSLRANYYLTRDWNLELEFGGRWSKREQGPAIDETWEYFLIAGVRYDFNLE